MEAAGFIVVTCAQKTAASFAAASEAGEKSADDDNIQERRRNIGRLLKRYVINVDCEAMARDERYERAAA